MNEHRADRDRAEPAVEPADSLRARKQVPVSVANPSSPIIALQQTAGNQAVQQLLRAGLIQTKLTVSSPGDPDEQEAERMVGRVMRMRAGSPAGGSCSCAGEEEQCESCRHQDALIQRNAAEGGTRGVVAANAPSAAAVVGRESGHSLDASTRAFFEPRFGYDFSSVRVHTGADASSAARSVHARAFTFRDNIAFDSGEYAPASDAGKRLIAHELTHVVQQDSAGPVVHRQPAAATKDDEAALVQKDWSDVNDVGIAYKEGAQSDNGGVNLHDSPGGPVLQWLPQNTKVFIIREDSLANGWYAVVAADKSSRFGYVLKSYIWRNLPDPEANVYKVKPGDTALGVARRQYAGTEFNVSGKDKRYIVNALVWVNSHAKHNSGSAAAIYKEEWVVAGVPVAPQGDDRSPWDLAKLIAGAYIWLPSPAYLNAIYEEVAEHGGGTGSIKEDLWRGIKKVGHYLAYGLAFIGGLIHGFFKSLWDTVAGLVSMVYDILKSIFTGSVISDVEELADTIGSLKWEQIKDAIGKWADEWSEKLNSSSPWVAGHAHGYLTGYVMAEAAMLLLSGGALTELKGAVWGSRFGKALQETAAFKRFASGVAKVGEVSAEARKAIGRAAKVIEKTEAGRVAIGAAKVIQWTAGGIMKVLALPSEIAQYLTDSIINGLKRLEPEFDRIRSLSTTAKRWLFGCKVACAVDVEAIAGRLKLPDQAIEAAAERELGATSHRASHPAPPDQTHATPNAADSKKGGAGEHEKAKGESALNQETERVPGEPAELLPDGGDARVSDEGFCKICHSPCKRQLQMAREALQAARGTAYEGYLENLLKRVQLLDDAMEESKARKALRSEYRSRFRGSVRRVSNEVDLAYRRFVQRLKVRLPAADEIEGFEAGKGTGIVDDPSWYDKTRRPERALEGTAYHDRIEAAVAAALPENSIYTEDTIQEFFKQRNIKAAGIPKKSSGIDLYVIDSQRRLVYPVDITGVAGAGKHVSKLGKDVEGIRAAFRKAGLFMTEPIEIEYVGQTFDEAAAGIINELRAYTR